MNAYQEAANKMQMLIEAAQEAVEKVAKEAARIEGLTCHDAAQGAKGADLANPDVTRAKAYAMSAAASLSMCKASATDAASYIPEISLQFGGGGK